MLGSHACFFIRLGLVCRASCRTTWRKDDIQRLLTDVGAMVRPPPQTLNPSALSSIPKAWIPGSGFRLLDFGAMSLS